MIQLKQSILLSVFLLAGVYTSAQTTVNFTSTGTLEDAMVGNGGIEQMNFGSQNQMRVYYELNQQMANVFRTFIQFDVSSIPEEAIVTSATLKLYPQQVNNAVNHPIYIERVDSNAWTEGSITWNNQPGVKTDQLAFSHAQTTSTSVHSFDVTNHVEKMVDYPNLNNGWRIRLQTESGSAPHGIVYHSSEATNSPKRPVLTVQYIMPIEITPTIVHNSADSTNATLSAVLSGGSTYDINDIYFYGTARDTTQLAQAVFTNVKTTYNVQYNTATKTITAENIDPGIYVIRVVDDAYNINNDSKFNFYKHIFVGREGEITDGILIPNYNYHNDARIAIDKPTNNNPTDRANTNFYTPISLYSLNVGDVPDNREEASLIRYMAHFDDQLDFTKVELNIQAYSQFYRGNSSSNAVNYSLVTSDWDERSVTWNTRPTIDSTKQIYIPTTTAIGFDNTHARDTVSLLPFVEEWQANPSQNFGFEIALETYGAADYANRNYYTTYQNRTWLYVRFEVNNGLTATFYDSTNTGSIAVEAPTGTLPYTYLISAAPIGTLQSIWDEIKDSTFIDSVSFFTGDVNSTSYAFNDLPSGDYYVNVFEDGGAKIMSAKKTVRAPLEFSSLNNLNTDINYNVVKKPAASQGSARFDAELLADSDYGGIHYQIESIGESYVGFNKTADTQVATGADFEFALKLEDNGDYRIVEDGVEGSVLGAATAGDEVIILEEYSDYVAIVAGTEVYRSTIGALDTNDLSVETLVKGATAKLKFKHYKGKYKKDPYSVKVKYPECGEFEGNISVQVPLGYSITGYSLTNNDPDAPSGLIAVIPTSLSIDFSNVPIGTYTLDVTYYNPDGYGYSVTQQVAVGYVVEWENADNSTISGLNTINKTPFSPVYWATANSSNATVNDIYNWVQFETFFNNVGDLLDYSSKEYFILKNQSEESAFGLYNSYYGNMQLNPSYISLSEVSPNGIWRVEEEEGEVGLYYNNVLKSTASTSFNGPYKIHILQTGPPKYIKTIASFCSNYPILDQYVEPKRTIEGGYYLIPSDDLLRFEFNEEYVPETGGDLAYVVRDYKGQPQAGLDELDEIFGDNRFELDVSSLTSGFYILEVKNLKGEDWFLRFEVQ